MFKKLLLAIVTLIATMGLAFADVDVNKADQAALDGVKGIGPKISKTILDERKKGGDFKDWADFEKRVKGIGDKSAVHLSENGLTVNGQPHPKASASASAGKEEKTGKKAKAESDKDTKHAASESKDAKAADTKDVKKDTKKEESKK